MVAFDRKDKLDGSGTFMADSTSINVPVGSTYSVQANVAYANGAVRPTGPFVSDYLIDIGSGETVSKHLVATSLRVAVRARPRAQGPRVRDLGGEDRLEVPAEVTRAKAGAHTSRITVAVWRPA